MEPSLMGQGVELMLYGMGTVFVFLAILVLATSAMSSLVQRFFPAPTPSVPAAPSNAAGPAPHEDSALIAVISAAINKHRSRHK
jgi:oxaloacetate decarboxylase gamma subunit